jgi:hypothetical protein
LLSPFCYMSPTKTGPEEGDGRTVRVCSLGPDPIDADLFDGPPPDRLQLALWPPPMTYLWLLPCASQQGPEEEGERPAGREV